MMDNHVAFSDGEQRRQVFPHFNPTRWSWDQPTPEYRTLRRRSQPNIAEPIPERGFRIPQPRPIPATSRDEAVIAGNARRFIPRYNGRLVGIWGQRAWQFFAPPIQRVQMVERIQTEEVVEVVEEEVGGFGCGRCCIAGIIGGIFAVGIIVTIATLVGVFYPRSQSGSLTTSLTMTTTPLPHSGLTTTLSSSLALSNQLWYNTIMEFCDMPWTDAYLDPNSPEYRSLSNLFAAALSDIFPDSYYQVLVHYIQKGSNVIIDSTTTFRKSALATDIGQGPNFTDPQLLAYLLRRLNDAKYSMFDCYNITQGTMLETNQPEIITTNLTLQLNVTYYMEYLNTSSLAYQTLVQDLVNSLERALGANMLGENLFYQALITRIYYAESLFVEFLQSLYRNATEKYIISSTGLNPIPDNVYLWMTQLLLKYLPPNFHYQLKAIRNAKGITYTLTLEPNGSSGDSDGGTEGGNGASNGGGILDNEGFIAFGNSQSGQNGQNSNSAGGRTGDFH